MMFTVATYNVLASAYIKPGRYPATPAAVLEAPYRTPAIVERLVQLQADLLCLQEVETPLFEAALRRLAPLGYDGVYTQKTRGQPDGCAIFFHTAIFTPALTTSLAYEDATAHTPATGHVAQLLLLHHGPHLLGVANTHLRWSPPGTPRAQHNGYRQLQLLVHAQATQGSQCTGWLLCGDFNVEPESPVLEVLRDAGFTSSHARRPAPATCYANNRAQTLDFVFYQGLLQAAPGVLPRLTDATPLPSFDQPSDHLPVNVRCTWVT